MKFYIALMTLCMSYSSFASNVSWDTQSKNTEYRTTKKLELLLEESKLIIAKGSKVKLVEYSELSMIKVHLFKYKLETCSQPSKESDLELIETSKNISVGVNLAKECILEVFVELKDHNSESFLK